MTKPHTMRMAGFLILLAAMAVPGQQSVAASPEVVGQHLAKLQIPEKISAVLWTRREGHYTLQVMRRLAPTRGRLSQMATGRQPDAPSPTAQRWAAEAATLQVWLLRADGSVITPTRRRETPPPSVAACEAGIATRCLGDEILFSFPASAGEEAVAVAMTFGGEYLIEKLEKFPD